MTRSGDKPDLGRYLERLDPSTTAARLKGRVREVTGLVVRASAPGVTIGELVEIEARSGPLQAQVVGFKDELAVLMPLGPLDGVGPQSAITATGEPPRILCGRGLLGRVLDGLGRPMDGLGALGGAELRPWALDRAPPDPMRRQRIVEPFCTGVRAIDGLMTLGVGQRVGLFAESGVGKSFLMGRLARDAEADVAVICLVGERGREVRDFIEDSLGLRGLERSVVVCATSDAPGLVRLKAASVATSIAEFFREEGLRVLLMMDSVTRLAQAQREVGLAAGEPPVRRGFPPSAFSMLPRLLERAGQGERGSITAIYTVLVAEDAMGDPIADEVRSILDGHIVLSRALAQRAHHPAIDPLRSLSRLMGAVTDAPHRRAAEAFRRALATYEARRDLIAMGAWTRGADPALDEAVDMIEEMEAFLLQEPEEASALEATVDHLRDLFG